MIKKLEINTYESLGETTITVECGLFSTFGQAEVIKAIVETINMWETKPKKGN